MDEFLRQAVAGFGLRQVVNDAEMPHCWYAGTCDKIVDNALLTEKTQVLPHCHICDRLTRCNMVVTLWRI
jgi:hypothetical protein